MSVLLSVSVAILAGLLMTRVVNICYFVCSSVYCG